MSDWAEQLATRSYNGVWNFLVPWLKVPREAPSLPQIGDTEVQTSKPAEGFLRYLKFWFWIALWIVDLSLLALLIVLVVVNWIVFLVLFVPILILMVVPDLIAFVAIHLRYDSTWYVMNERSVRIRRGIWIIHETTISFENVQNVKVTQGPVQRYFGISNLLIETAGSGGSESAKKGWSVSNKGIIEGISHANETRDIILSRMRASRSAGLGDDDDIHDSDITQVQLSMDQTQLLEEIRDELRGLNAAVSGAT